MNRDLARYHRQMLLEGFGEDGQVRLLDSTAVLLGCGALGSVAADLLARAGVGRLIIIDRDFIELTNLQRQVLFDEQDVAEGLPKAEAARRKIAAINSQIEVSAVVDDINHTNIERYAVDADILIDGLDNLETRYLANDLAVKAHLPYLYGAAVGTTGMVYPVLPHGTGDAPWETVASGSVAGPCLRCLFEDAPAPGSLPTCDTVGVFSPVVAMIATLQVSEALKILTGNFAQVTRRLLNVDLWSNDIRPLGVANAYAEGDCPCCKQRRFDYLEGKAGSTAAALCGRDAVQLRHRQEPGAIDFGAIAARLEPHAEVRANEYMLRARVIEGDSPYEITLFPDGRAIIKGTDQQATARRVFAKYVGA